MCCDGTLFTHVLLSAEDAARLPSDAPEARKDGSLRLKQRCRFLSGCDCTIYAQRPSGCSQYRCMLGFALVEEEVRLPEALRMVEEAHRRLQMLETSLPPRTAAEPASTLQRAQRSERGLWSEDAKHAYAEAVEYLHRHFHREGRSG